MRWLPRQKWESGRLEWNEALAKYVQHRATIIEKVPPTLREFEFLQQRHDFHDEQFIRLHRLATDRVTIELGNYWVELYDVQSCRFDQEESDRNTIWLIHEIDLPSPGQFRLTVLFEGAELDTVAKTIHVWSRREHRILVPEQLPTIKPMTSKRHR